MLVTQLFIEQIPEIYTRFSQMIGDQHWKHRVMTLKQEIRGNHFLENFLKDENSIAFTLDRLRELNAKYGAIPIQIIHNARNTIFPAISFAAQVLSIIENSNATQSRRLKRRVHGAIKNPDDLRALQLELSTATHFLRRGYRVSWPEMNGADTFDLLIEDAGESGLEIECKSISQDKGRKIHRREALEFNSLLNSHLEPVNRNLSKGLSVILTVPGRLPTDHKQRVTLAKCLITQILAGQSTSLADGTDIRISDFPIDKFDELDPVVNLENIRNAVDKITSTTNRESMIVGTHAGGRLIITLQSKNNDQLLASVFDSLSDSAKYQLSRARPAVFIVGFHGIDSSQLINIAEQDNTPGQPPTALRIAVSKFLASTERDHVVGVGFLSRSGSSPVQNGYIDTGGTAYYFKKMESPFWDNSFSGMFAWSSPSNALANQIAN